ncbi:aldo/keto reductase [Paenibacillus sp. WQ 127069]|uniref:Aldo/keto reductase n=1 Tax=Paenibacillus baimaensis TaxID=2982185 RepID=A0ABT2UUJ0_9BACL|nr:aldo/keto reductase [Paenibacillus sp. WQ 127069]MCU6798314.1 aldo/keto reductase [Paenibacillus sp. WQ 127069]
MKKRVLGTSGIEVSVLGMGCWQYGGGTYWGEQSQKDVDEVVHKALDLGVNYFDTAEVYNDGASELALGISLKGRRAQAIIGSKISTSNTQPSVLRAHCEASLKRLQTDYIDLYMLHWPISPLSVKHFTQDAALIANPPQLQEVFETLQSLQKEGKIRHIGISNHGVKQMKEVQDAGVKVVANEMAYNLLSRAIEESVLPYCIQNEIGVIGYMPLLQGLLTDKVTSLDELRPLQARSRHFHHSRGEGTRHGEEGAEAEIKQALQEIRLLAHTLGTPIITLALAWAISNEAICTTIVGSRNVKQLELNIQGASYELSQATIQRLNEITEPVLQRLGSNPDYYESRLNSRIY